MAVLDSSVLDEAIRLVPGYDPHRDAEGFYFDEETASEAVAFFPEILTHVKGSKAGDPFVLEPWEVAIIANAFGWLSTETGFRRYSTVFVYVARKNGKTCLVAGVVLLVLVWDGEKGAEIYSAAAEREQAALVFQQAAGMVRGSPDLSSRLKLYQRSIAYEPMGSFYKPISAEASTKHGYGAHVAVVDELHAQPDRELVDVLETSMGARDQPMMWHITTADFARPSICNETLDYARKVRDGVIVDPSFLPVIYEATTEDDWTSESTWRKANPNLGVSVSLDYLRKKCKKAQEEPAFENTFKRLHLNIVTEADVRLVKLERWDASAGDPVDVDELDGRAALGAFDLSTTTDLSAWVLLFPPETDDDPYVVLPRFFIPEENAHERERRDRVPYLKWAREGLVTMTAGNQIDYRHVRAVINEDAARFRIGHIGYDPYNASHLVTELQEEDGMELVVVRQGMPTMSPATKETLRLVGDGKIRHGGNEALRWQANNASAKTDHLENIMPHKAKSTGRIDGFVALVMCVALSMVYPEVGSRYDDGEGLLTVDLSGDVE